MTTGDIAAAEKTARFPTPDVTLVQHVMPLAAGQIGWRVGTTVVSREGAMMDSAVVTVRTLQAGMNEHVIPDHALVRLNVRTFKEEVRTRVLAAVKRILESEAAASGAPKPLGPSVLSEFPLTRDAERVTELAPATASEHNRAGYRNA